MQYLALFPFAFVFESNYTADRIMCCISGYVNICVPWIFLSDTFKPGLGHQFQIQQTGKSEVHNNKNNKYAFQ